MSEKDKRVAIKAIDTLGIEGVDIRRPWEFQETDTQGMSWKLCEVDPDDVAYMYKDKETGLTKVGLKGGLFGCESIYTPEILEDLKEKLPVDFVELPLAGIHEDLSPNGVAYMNPASFSRAAIFGEKYCSVEMWNSMTCLEASLTENEIFEIFSEHILIEYSRSFLGCKEISPLSKVKEDFIDNYEEYENPQGLSKAIAEAEGEAADNDGFTHNDM